MSNKVKTTRFSTKLHVKSGDKVMVMAGDDKGKTGVIAQVFPSKMRAIVEGVNMMKKHVKPTQNKEGGILEMEAPLHLSKLMLLDSKGNPTRTGRKLEDGKTVRYAKTTGETIR
jgi:large subunit ribosomal protein L24